MSVKRSRAATAVTAPLNSTMAVYHGTPRCATAINDVLARLLFALESPHLTSLERPGVLSMVDQLLRLKVDLGLLEGVTHGQ
jgi:hypothetical protein